MAMVTVMPKEDYEKNIPAEFTQVNVGGVELSIIKNIHAWWAYYQTDRLASYFSAEWHGEGDTVILNSDREAAIGALLVSFSFVMEANGDRQKIVRDLSGLSVFAYPSASSQQELSHEGRGSFRTLLDGQIQDAFYRSSRGRNFGFYVRGWGVDNARILKAMGDPVGEWGLKLCTIQSKGDDLKPLQQLQDAPALGSDPAIRNAMCSYIASMLQKPLMLAAPTTAGALPPAEPAL